MSSNTYKQCYFWLRLFATPVPAGRVIKNRECPFFHRSFSPPFCLSVNFLRIGSLVFSETTHAVRRPYIVVCDNQAFWKKISNGQKWPKMCPKTWFLDILRTSCHYFCLEIVLNESSYSLLTFCETACLGKTWFSSYSQKWLLANEISVFFNCQYFTNRFRSHFDFWHVDRNEWKEQSSLTGFLKKL